MAKHVTVRWHGELDFDATDPVGAIVPMSSKEDVFGPSLLVLAALGGCTGMDAVSVMTKKRVEFDDYRVEVTGEQREGYPRSYSSVTVEHIVRRRSRRRPGRGPSYRALRAQVLCGGCHHRQRRLHHQPPHAHRRSAAASAPATASPSAHGVPGSSTTRTTEPERGPTSARSADLRRPRAAARSMLSSGHFTAQVMQWRQFEGLRTTRSPSQR